jgi:hypothetical protein
MFAWVVATLGGSMHLFTASNSGVMSEVMSVGDVPDIPCSPLAYTVVKSICSSVAPRSIIRSKTLSTTYSCDDDTNEKMTSLT